MDERKKNTEDKERDILFSRTIKAGQRIYYVDVKQNRKNEMYLSITESKKMISGDAEMPQVSYEKHKIFLYREDFQKFQDSLQEAIQFINREQGDAEPRKEIAENEIKIDMEF
ncbi:MAG: DUF3276 family protein [Bacteroidaceae bacterium]|nr:DUF3276 family protein [Bacteroidaceae bacterium]